MVNDRSGRLQKLNEATLYLVVGLEPKAGPLLQTVEAALEGGVTVVQLREKEHLGRPYLEAAEALRELCARRGALLLLDDHPALALALGADGVHLGQGDMPATSARRLVGEELLIGLSTHSPAELEAGLGLAVDYFGVGPVFATPTKAGRRPTGLSYVRFAAAHADRPWFAIGGITPDNAAQVAAAGGRRLAVVRAIAEAQDPQKAAAALKAALAQEAFVGARS